MNKSGFVYSIFTIPIQYNMHLENKIDKMNLMMLFRLDMDYLLESLFANRD